MGTKLPSLFPSTFYCSIAVFFNFLVQSLVIMTDPILWKLKLWFLPCQFLWVMSEVLMSWHVLWIALHLSLAVFWQCCPAGVSACSLEMVISPTSCTQLPKSWLSVWLMCCTAIAASLLGLSFCIFCELFLLLPFWLAHLIISNSLYSSVDSSMAFCALCTSTHLAQLSSCPLGHLIFLLLPWLVLLWFQSYINIINSFIKFLLIICPYLCTYSFALTLRWPSTPQHFHCLLLLMYNIAAIVSFLYAEAWIFT